MKQIFTHSPAPFFLLLCVFISSGIKGQSSFYQEYPSLPDQYFADIIAWPDGTFNGINSKVSSSPLTGYEHFAGYSSFLSTGELLSTAPFPGDDLARPSGISLSGSEWLFTTPKFFNNDDWSDPGVDLELHILSNTLDTLMRWSIEVVDYTVYHARSTSTSDGGYMAVATLGSNGSTAPLGFKTRVWKWDATANLIWSHDWSWGTDSSSMNPDLYAASDGNVYVHCLRSSSASSYMHVSRFSNLGLEWEDSFSVSVGGKHFVGRDSGFAILSHVHDLPEATDFFEVNFYDLNGVLEFSTLASIPPATYVVIEDVASHPNGEFGVLYRGVPVSAPAFDSYVLRIDRNGVVMGQTFLADVSTGCTCESLNGLYGGGYLASGVIVPGLFTAHIPCVFKIDADGVIARSTLTGYAFVDENGNNMRDGMESSLSATRLNFFPYVIPTYTASDGFYARNFYTLDSVKIEAQVPDYMAQRFPDPTLYSFVPSTLDGGMDQMDIALEVTESIEEFEIVLAGGDAIPGFNYPVWITCKNRGSVFDDMVYVDYVMPPSSTFVTALPAPFVIEGDTLRFALQFTEFFEDHQINVVMLLDPDISLLGDTLWSMARITVPESDHNPSNNSYVEPHRVRAAYDPNQKTVEPLGIGPGNVSDTTEWLTYTIDFQNTGNYHASLVRLMDVLPQHVQPLSLEFLASSHEPVTLHFENSHTAVWTFDPIVLPDSSTDLLGSMGYVKFRIRPVPDLELGTVIRNQAHIYFDFNPPISTAFTNTIWGIPETNAVIEGVSSPAAPLLIYPNPAGEIAYVLNIPEDAVLMNLVNSTGSVVTSKRIADWQNLEALSLANIPNGYYFVVIYTNSSNYKVLRSSLAIQR